MAFRHWTKSTRPAVTSTDARVPTHIEPSRTVEDTSRRQPQVPPHLSMAMAFILFWVSQVLADLGTECRTNSSLGAFQSEPNEGRGIAEAERAMQTKRTIVLRSFILFWVCLMRSRVCLVFVRRVVDVMFSRAQKIEEVECYDVAADLAARGRWRIEKGTERSVSDEACRRNDRSE